MAQKYGGFTEHKILKRFICIFVTKNISCQQICFNDMLYVDLGRFPLHIIRNLRILKDLLKVSDA